MFRETALGRRKQASKQLRYHVAETETLSRYAAENHGSPVPDPEVGSSWLLEAGGTWCIMGFLRVSSARSMTWLPRSSP